ncbi:hypothetical protein DRW03_12810 [Corallococcus sp. H22C18031201]|nr:hypothetical protein DRW03_12810 [Corallococcus sp. H22C18031201]
MRHCGVAVLLLLSGCADGSGYVRQGMGQWFGRDANGAVWVRGPWPEIQSSADVDDVIDQLCPAIMKLPNAMDGDWGQEYCGALYSLGDGIYHASYGSPLGPTVLVGASKRKQCSPPRTVVDPRGRAMPLGDFHSHPWAPSEMSSEDRRKELQRFVIRIQFDTSCRVLKLIPYVNEPRPGEVYVRDGRRWVLIGHIRNEDKASGRITSVDDR